MQQARRVRVDADRPAARRRIGPRFDIQPPAVAAVFEFAYRGPGKDGKPAPWLYEWEHPEALPAQVRVRIVDAQGAWPDLVVAPPAAGSYGVPPEAGP